MSHYVVPNLLEHGHLSVNSARSDAFGDGVNFIDVVANEFRSLAGYYPILISKDATSGKFVFISIFGFDAGQNEFLVDAQWDATYIPINIRRQPFSLQPKTNDKSTHLVMCLDLDHPRVNVHEGQPLFNEHKPSDFLLQTEALLKRLYIGVQQSQALLTLLTQHQLIEPLTMRLSFVDGSESDLNGLYCINESALENLDVQALMAFKQAGVLHPMYAMVSSLSQIGQLVQRKNKRLVSSQS